MVESLDSEAARTGITRQSIIKVRLVERMKNPDGRPALSQIRRIYVKITHDIRDDPLPISTLKVAPDHFSNGVSKAI